MSLTQLWAPWRMEFLEKAHAQTKTGCIFCDLPKEKNDKETLIVFRGDVAFVILNKYPYNNGHLMVVPNRHLSDFSLLEKKELTELMELARLSVEVLKNAYHPEGFNLGMNLGQSGGAGIRDHLHLHVVPRWLGDTNFLPVLAETKAMPQHLEKSFEVLSSLYPRKKP